MKWWSCLCAAVVLPSAFCFPYTAKAQGAPITRSAAVAADSDSVRIELKKKNPTGAMLRSLVLPGWGQLYNGKFLNAALVFGGEVGLYVTAAYWDRQANAAQGDYRLLYQDYRNTTIGWLAGTVLLSAVDAYVDARFSGRISSKEEKNPTGALLRSLAFPGWGQFYNRKYSKAFLFFGLETGLIATAIHWNQQAVATHGDIQAFYQNNRNTANWFLLATVVFSMLDAYVDASLFDFDESPDLSLAPPEALGNGAQEMRLRIKIKL